MKILLFALALAIVGAAVLWQRSPETLAHLLARTPLKELTATRPLYQWQDADGQWQVTDRPPSDGVPYQTRSYAIDANILPPVTGPADE